MVIHADILFVQRHWIEDIGESGRQWHRDQLAWSPLVADDTESRSIKSVAKCVRSRNQVEKCINLLIMQTPKIQSQRVVVVVAARGQRGYLLHRGNNQPPLTGTIIMEAILINEDKGD